MREQYVFTPEELAEDHSKLILNGALVKNPDYYLTILEYSQLGKKTAKEWLEIMPDNVRDAMSKFLRIRSWSGGQSSIYNALNSPEEYHWPSMSFREFITEFRYIDWYPIRPKEKYWTDFYSWVMSGGPLLIYPKYIEGTEIGALKFELGAYKNALRMVGQDKYPRTMDYFNASNEEKRLVDWAFQKVVDLLKEEIAKREQRLAELEGENP